MASEWLTPAVITTLIGALAAALGIIVKTRVDLRKAKLDEERQPAEIENIFIGGAEKAVAALQVALDRAETTIGRLERALTERDEKLQERDQRIAELEMDVTRTLARLARIQDQCERLQGRLADLRIDPKEGETI